jgi:hypothetical protein
VGAGSRLDDGVGGQSRAGRSDLKRFCGTARSAWSRRITTPCSCASRRSPACRLTTPRRRWDFAA